VCSELGIAYEGRDLKEGFDATKAEAFRGLGKFDFIWLHPPYFQMVRYNPKDTRCLSTTRSVDEFTSKLRAVFKNCRSVLADTGHLAVLMGDGKHEGRYLGLPFRTMNAAEAEGFWLAAPEIIRFSHGATSSGRVYTKSFIPRLHDVCLVLHQTRQGREEVQSIKRAKYQPRGERMSNVIFSYTRAQAIADGVLIEMSELATEAGFRYPVALTQAVWADYVTVPDGVEGQDEKGRLWDILFIGAFTIRQSVASGFKGSEVRFKLHVRNTNDQREPPLVELKALCGPDDDGSPCITIMHPWED
jgi:hypothetical protein